MPRAGRLLGFAFAVVFSAGWAAAQNPPQVQPAPAPVPESPFLFINQERLLTGSQVGQALLSDEEKRRDELRSEARALDSAFELEERQLTDQRPTMKPEDFRKLADAFDARVVQARKDQDVRASALAQEFDQRRRQFYARVAPLLVELMDRGGARAVFDENSALLTDQTLNITDEVIAAIDADAGAATAAPASGQGGSAPDSPAVGAIAPAPLLSEDGRPLPRPEEGN